MEIGIPGISVHPVIPIFQCGVRKLEWLKYNVPETPEILKQQFEAISKVVSLKCNELLK